MLNEIYHTQNSKINGMEFYYLKTKRGAKTPDYIVKEPTGDIVIEVGGKGKGHNQFKGISVGRKLILSHLGKMEGIKRPLFLLGYL